MSNNYLQSSNEKLKTAPPTYYSQSSSWLPSKDQLETQFQPFASFSSSQLNRLSAASQLPRLLPEGDSVNQFIPNVSAASVRFNSNAIPFSPGIPYQQTHPTKITPQASIWSPVGDTPLVTPNQTPNYQDLFTMGPLQILNRQQSQFNANIDRGVSRSLSKAKSVSVSQYETYQINAYTDTVDYKQLLNKRATCNWSMIVCKIIYLDEAPATAFLLQKLRLGHPEQQAGIIEAVSLYALPLMLHYNGNFLLQRCLDLANTHQIQKLIREVPENVVPLAICVSGSHVLQKLLDHALVEDSFKLLLINNLISAPAPYDLFSTLTHEMGCRVWQRVMTVNLKINNNDPKSISSESPHYIDQIITAMKGKWCEIGLHNMGSLVIQGIFESATPDQKQPLIDELIGDIDELARGQWGTWVVQHMLKQGDDITREATIKNILDNAAALSCNIHAIYCVLMMIECYYGDDLLDRDEISELKTQTIAGDNEKSQRVNTIITRFLKAIVPFEDGRRAVLVDIAANAHGHVIIPLLYSKANPEERALICRVINKHSVSLLRSKIGTKTVRFIRSQK